MSVSDGRGRWTKKISGRSDRDAKLGMKDCQHRSAIKRPTCMSFWPMPVPKAVGTPSARSAAPERRDIATGNGSCLGDGRRGDWQPGGNTLKIFPARTSLRPRSPACALSGSKVQGIGRCDAGRNPRKGSSRATSSSTSIKQAAAGGKRQHVMGWGWAYVM